MSVNAVCYSQSKGEEVQGKIIEYVDQSKFICGLVQQENGKRLHVLNQNGREVKLPVGRVVHCTEQRYTVTSREDILNLLVDVAETRRQMMDPINLDEIWELAVEEDDSAFTARFLTELAFDDAATDDHVAAFLRRVFADPFFFKYKSGKVQVHPVEVVAQLKLRAEKEREKEALLEAGAKGLRAIFDGEDVDWPDKQKCLTMCGDYYVHGNDAEEATLTRDLLKRANLSRLHDPFHLLVKAGVWQDDENIALLKADLPVEFSDKESHAVADCLEKFQDFSDDNRLDLRDLPLLTIDAESTRDLDDALHLEKKGDNYIVGIHIADVSHYVKPNSVLFETARDRVTSVYMADQQVPMLPRELSEDACSLIAGVDRPALSTLVELTPNGEVVNTRIVRSVVQVKRRLSYNGVLDSLTDGSDEEVTILSGLAQNLLLRRVENGAVVMPVPDVNISLGDQVKVTLADSNSLSRTLVAEFMVLANVLGAQYVSTRMEAGLYRSQEPPRQRLYEGVQKDLFLNFKQRRCLSRGHLRTMAKSHSGIGADCYTTVTSPIRRFLDLVMQHQLSGMISRKGTPFTEKDCQGFVGNIQNGLSRASRVRIGRHRYWMMKYLEQQGGSGTVMDALVLDVQSRRVQVVLTDILLEGDLPKGSGVQPGDIIKVKIGRVNALDNSFKLEW
jgi:exoribonuclease-2